MNIFHDAAGQPAGAGSMHASTSTLVALVTAGSLAMDLWRAEVAVTNARDAYHGDIRDFEAKFGSINIRIDPNNPTHRAIIEYTADRRAALVAARRKAQAVRRRLRAACEKSARQAATEPARSRGVRDDPQLR
jgi:hypothetical protein